MAFPSPILSRAILKISLIIAYLFKIRLKAFTTVQWGCFILYLNKLHGGFFSQAIYIFCVTGMSEKTDKMTEILKCIINQNSILDRVIDSLDNIDRRVKRIEEKFA